MSPNVEPENSFARALEMSVAWSLLKAEGALSINVGDIADITALMGELSEAQERIRFAKAKLEVSLRSSAWQRMIVWAGGLAFLALFWILWMVALGGQGLYQRSLSPVESPIIPTLIVFLVGILAAAMAALLSLRNLAIRKSDFRRLDQAASRIDAHLRVGQNLVLSLGGR